MKKISKKTWAYIAVGMNLITMLLYILIIARILPYSITAGGQLPSYEVAVISASGCMIIQIFLIINILITSGIIKTLHFQKASRIIVFIFIIYFCFNIIMNLFGVTWFEKIGASLMAVVQIVCLYHIWKKDK